MSSRLRHFAFLLEANIRDSRIRRHDNRYQYECTKPTLFFPPDAGSSLNHRLSNANGRSARVRNHQWHGFGVARQPAGTMREWKIEDQA